MRNRLPDDSYSYCPFNYIDEQSLNGVTAGQWRNDASPNTSLYPIAKVGSNNYSKYAKTTRDNFKKYFNSPEGEISWQWEMVRRFTIPFDERV